MAPGWAGMSRFRFFPKPAHILSMGSVVKQEAFMSWNGIAGSFKRLKDEIVSQWSRLADDKSTSFDLIGPEMSSHHQSSDMQMSVFRRDDRGKRSEFSLHIGC
jgi:hypothetical protein